MSKTRGVPIPSLYDISNVSRCRLGLFLYPCDKEWESIVYGLISSLARGRYWEAEETRTKLLPVLEISKWIRDSFMACNLDELIHSLREIEYTLKHFKTLFSEDKAVSFEIEKPLQPTSAQFAKHISGEVPFASYMNNGEMSTFFTQTELLGYPTETVGVADLVKTIFANDSSIPFPDINPFNISSKVDTLNANILYVRDKLEEQRLQLEYLQSSLWSSNFTDFNPLTSESFYNLVRRSLNNTTLLNYIPAQGGDKPFLEHAVYQRKSAQEIEYTLKHLATLLGKDKQVSYAIAQPTPVGNVWDVLKHLDGTQPVLQSITSSNKSVFETDSASLDTYNVADILFFLKACMCEQIGGGAGSPVDLTVLETVLGNIDTKMGSLSHLAELVNLAELTKLVDLSNLQELNKLVNLQELNKLVNLQDIGKLSALVDIVAIMQEIKTCVCQDQGWNLIKDAIDLAKGAADAAASLGQAAATGAGTAATAANAATTAANTAATTADAASTSALAAATAANAISTLIAPVVAWFLSPTTPDYTVKLTEIRDAITALSLGQGSLPPGAIDKEALGSLADKITKALYEARLAQEACCPPKHTVQVTGDFQRSFSRTGYEDENGYYQDVDNFFNSIDGFRSGDSESPTLEQGGTYMLRDADRRCGALQWHLRRCVEALQYLAETVFEVYTFGAYDIDPITRQIIYSPFWSKYIWDMTPNTSVSYWDYSERLRKYATANLPPIPMEEYYVVDGLTCLEFVRALINQALLEKGQATGKSFSDLVTDYRDVEPFLLCKLSALTDFSVQDIGKTLSVVYGTTGVISPAIEGFAWLIFSGFNIIHYDLKAFEPVSCCDSHTFCKHIYGGPWNSDTYKAGTMLIGNFGGFLFDSINYNPSDFSAEISVSDRKTNEIREGADPVVGDISIDATHLVVPYVLRPRSGYYKVCMKILYQGEYV